VANLKVYDQGKAKALDVLRQFWNGGARSRFRLYVDETYVWEPGDDLATLMAIEASFPGYTYLDADDWGAPTGPDGSLRYTTIASMLTWTCTDVPDPEETVYGYFVTDEESSIVLWAQAAATPKLIASAGDFYAVIPRFTDKSEF